MEENLHAHCWRPWVIEFFDITFFLDILKMYTQLPTKLPGDTGVQGMIPECTAMEGRSYGSAGEFCVHHVTSDENGGIR